MKNESKSSLKCQQWIKVKGKEKIQSFQDAFVESFDISLCLLSLDCEPLTVWSNSSLFCDYMMKKKHDRCMLERQKIIKSVIKNKTYTISTCYMGITYFAFPVFCNKELIAICFGGAVYLEENYNSTNNKIREHTKMVSERKLKDLIKMLESIFDIFDVEEDTNYSSKDENNERKQELSFLQKRVSLRELDIVKLINDGLTNKEIAQQLYISERTVKVHVSNILKKLKLKNRMQIIILCKQIHMA